jgi:AraC-like DNA-binding protein
MTPTGSTRTAAVRPRRRQTRSSRDDARSWHDGRSTRSRTVLARVVARMIDRAAAEGMNRQALVEAAGLRDVDLTDGDSRVPVSAQAALWRLIAKGIPDPGFAVRAGASMKVREAGLLGYVMSYSATLGDALRRLVRYSHILTDAVEFRLEPPQRRHVAVAQCHPALGVGLPFAIDYRLTAGLSICRQITGVGIVPFEIDFSYDQPASTLEHRRFFRCPMRFGQPKSRVVLFERDLSLPVPQGDETLAGYLTAYAEEVLRSLVSGPSIRERVRSAIWAALADGRPTLRRIASALGLPSRTLQRRLADEGTSLHQEVEDIRKAMAMAMLRDREISIDEVAFLLGYAEPSTLFRSFKRWTGMTPRAYRGTIV